MDRASFLLAQPWLEPISNVEIPKIHGNRPQEDRQTTMFKVGPSATANATIQVGGTTGGGISGALESTGHQWLFHGRASFHVHEANTQMCSDTGELMRSCMAGDGPTSRQGGIRPQRGREGQGSENSNGEGRHVFCVADMTCPRISNRTNGSNMQMSPPNKKDRQQSRQEKTRDARASEPRMWVERLVEGEGEGDGEGEGEEHVRSRRERPTRSKARESRGGWSQGPLADDAVMLWFPEQGNIKEGAMWVGERELYPPQLYV